MQEEDVFKRLEYAKDAVKYCLNDADGLVDLHNIVYWAGRVEEIRKEIRGML